ncbi:LOW QUALITY PROTEIN: P2Y purinoceptor 11 [Hipposideros larvatus]
MATAATGVPPCPANISGAADRKLNSFQEGFLPLLVVEFLVAVAFSFSTGERPWHPLAVSNLLYARLSPLAYLEPSKQWHYGEATCYLERFLCNMLGGVIFITCISIDCYLGIVHPFFTRGHLRPKHALAISTTGWVLAALLAAPTLSFSHLTVPQQEGNCTEKMPQACIKCLGTAGDNQLDAYKAHSLVLVKLRCVLPLLLTLVTYSALRWAVLHSHGLTAAQKMQLAVLVASGVALYACSYVPYYVTLVFNSAQLRSRARCPEFADAAQAVEALDLGSYVGHQVMQGLMPLAICIHLLLYMAVVPSSGCCHLRCLGCREGQTPENTESSGQTLPLHVTTT